MILEKCEYRDTQKSRVDVANDTNVPRAALRLPTPMPRPSKAGTARASTPSKRLQSLVSRRDRLGGLGADQAHQRFAAAELHQGVQLGSIRPIGTTATAAAWPLQDLQMDP